MAEESDEDDPVVHEIDVFLAKALAERVYLFQYPVRPSFLTYDETDHISARIKPKQQRVELELALNSDSKTYCMPRGEQIAYAVDEATTSLRDKPPLYSTGCMDKQVLSSVRSSEQIGKYVAGVFKDGALHLTPVHGCIQLRPSFEYLDRADDNKQTTASANMEEEEEEEAKPVLTRFAKPELDSISLRKKQSVKSTEQKLAEEPWTDLRYYQPSSSKAQSERMLLRCHQQDFESPELTATSREYLKTLTPSAEGKESHPAELPHGVLSMASLRKMHILDQIKALLTNAKVIQFHHLMALLGSGLDEKTILKGLQMFAVMVQGCWVVKSEILYPKGTKCQISGINAESMWPARDYVMWRFNHKRAIERKDIISTVRIPSEELRDMLEQVARQKPPQGWEFMLPTDVDFLHKHNDAVKSQMDVWKDLVARFKQTLNVSKELLSKEDEILPGLDATLHARGRITKPRSRSRDSIDKPKRGSGTEEDRSQFKKTNDVERGSNKMSHRSRIKLTDSGDNISEINGKQDGDQTVKIKSEPGVNFQVKDEPMDFTEMSGDVSAVEMIVDSDNEQIVNNNSNVDHFEIEEEVDSNSSSISLPFIPPAASGKAPISHKPPSELFIQELDKFIKTTLKGGCLCLAEFKDILRLRQQEPGNILCSGVSDELLEQEILKVGAIQLEVKWPENVYIKPELKKVFAFRKTGDSRDKFRKVVLDLFKEEFSVKKAEVNKILQERIGDTLSNHIFPRFMMEFCEKYGTGWYLGGTYKAAYPDR